MKIVIFGVGRYYKNRKITFEWFKDSNIVFFSDNRANEIREFEGKKVFLPEELHTIDFDVVVIMTVQYNEVLNQLLELGIPENRIFSYDEFKPRLMQGQWEIYKAKKQIQEYKKKVLIFTSELGFNGGSIAILNAAIALIEKDYYVAIAVGENSNLSFIHEINRNRIDVIRIKSMPYIGGEDFELIKTFDIVISNVFQTINCAFLCSKILPVFWWIHENPAEYDPIYTRIRKEFSEIDYPEWMNRINIGAVSLIAKNAFEKYYPEKVKAILPLGIPDDNGNKEIKSLNKKTIFAVIGMIMPRKSQNVFLEAAKMVMDEVNADCEYWIVGGERNDSYTNELKEKYGNLEYIKFVGEKDRNEMKDIYPEIDVVVCSSIMETMSMVTIEGMMYSKLCITTNATGVAEYIEDGVNGFICKAGDVYDLYKKMLWIIEHKSENQLIRKNARKTYEKYFSLDVLGDRLEKIVNDTIDKFESRHIH